MKKLIIFRKEHVSVTRYLSNFQIMFFENNAIEVES